MSDPNEYTVGWISAISTESVAARAFLDEEHDGPRHVARHDNNGYVLGRIGGHNVVIAVLPDGEYGTTSAASVARDMLHSFPNIRIGLMVGIGGGAPSAKKDIRLGDVVVSSPGGGKGGVFQYDFGKTIQSQSFQTTGFLDQPPAVLRAAVSALKGTYELKGHQLADQVDKALKRIKKRKKYLRPPPASDRLYKAEVKHPCESSASCDATCTDDPTYLIVRQERDDEDDDPTIRYGLIASANQLMKDALIRDRLAAEKGVLCFEMEAAGLMSHFPCLVIRGICDYADSHKNNEWQGFAAMMAAAYTRDLLCQIHPNRVEAETQIKELLQMSQSQHSDGLSVSNFEVVRQDLGLVRNDMHVARAMVESREIKHRLTETERWLSPPDPSINANHARKLRHEGTGAWLLKAPIFEEWCSGSRRHLWLQGPAGSGKTILSTTILDFLARNTTHLLLQFFFDFGETTKQTLDGMLRSLVFQVYQSGIGSSAHLDGLFERHRDGRTRPDTKALSNVFIKMMTDQRRTFVLVDALDESRTRSEVVSWIELMASPELSHIQLLYTSRPEAEFLRAIPQTIGEHSCLPLDKKAVDTDIRAFVVAEVRQRRDFLDKELSQDLFQHICDKVGNGADGMFRCILIDKGQAPGLIPVLADALPLSLVGQFGFGYGENNSAV